MRRLLLSVLVWVALLAMAPSVRAAVCVAGQPSTAGNAASSAVTSLALANPGAQAGDVLLVQIVVGDSNSWITAPSGWTYYSNDTRGSLTQMLFYRVAGASEPSSYSFSFGSARAVGGLLLLRGVSVPGNGNPIVHVQNNSGTSSTLTALSANVVSANSLVVRSFAWGNGNDVLSGPATQHYTMATGAGPNGVAASSSSALSAGTGQSGNATATAGGSSDNWLAVTTVLAPGAGGGICSVSQVDHYELDYASNQALTCNPLAVTVRACANSSCSTLYGSPTSTILSATDISGSSVGNWSPNSLTFTGNGNSNYQLTTARLASLGISSASPTGSNPLRCVVGGVSGDNCLVSFADSGFILDVPNLLAAKPTAATIRAVRKDDASKACVPGFASGTRNVQFSSSYSDPINGTQPVVVNGTAVTSNTPVALTFDAAASASLTVRYDDAGQMNLSASYSGSGEESGLLMSGSDSFVARPAGYCVYSDSTNSDCASGDARCSAFVAAGDNFRLRVKAVAWEDVGVGSDPNFCIGNGATPNYQQSGIVLTSSLIAPAGGVAATLGVTNADIVDADDGEKILTNQTVSEVGVFTITATAAASYLGGPKVGDSDGDGVIDNISSSAYIGRFYPASFLLSDPTLTPACNSGFTYAGLAAQVGPPAQPVKIGQPFGFSGALSARNLGGAVTRNYTGSFAKLTGAGISYADSAAVSAGTVSASTYLTAGTSTAGTCNPGPDCRGYIDYSTKNPVPAPAGTDTATFLMNSAIAPYSLTIRSAAIDSNKDDPNCSDPLPPAAPTCPRGLAVTGSVTDLVIDPGTGLPNPALMPDFRLGQARIANAHGSELQALRLSITVGHFNGAGYVQNPLDSCTVFNVAALEPYQRVSGASPAAPVLLSYLNSTGGAVAPYVLSAGSSLAGGYLLSAPGAGNDGSVRLTYVTPTWLQFDWDGNGSLDHASALATFGIYKGATPLIFRRELYR